MSTASVSSSLEPCDTQKNVAKPYPSQAEVAREIAGASQQLLEAIWALDKQRLHEVTFERVVEHVSFEFDTRHELSSERGLEAAARAIVHCASEMGATHIINPRVVSISFDEIGRYAVSCGFTTAEWSASARAPSPNALLRSALKNSGSALLVIDESSRGRRSAREKLALEQCEVSAQALAHFASTAAERGIFWGVYVHLARIIIALSHNFGTISDLDCEMTKHGDAIFSWVRS